MLRFRKEWFNPFRDPRRLLRELKESINWLNDLEDTNVEYRKYSRKGSSSIIGLMIQVLLVAILMQVIIEVFLFD
ncbi:hypothetical protein LCGC14_2238530 [marine sediment metagenome]|uniref:Uncharacterized protein n=1 Tax=marine sediment metagenome TaxID=412755 RepID=A0A0F9D6A9_9ZZZZ